jgi:hypothetical protein
MVSYSGFRRLGYLAPVLLAAMAACLSAAPYWASSHSTPRAESP